MSFKNIQGYRLLLTIFFGGEKHICDGGLRKLCFVKFAIKILTVFLFLNCVYLESINFRKHEHRQMNKQNKW